jgi:hypothetical protein
MAKLDVSTFATTYAGEDLSGFVASTVIENDSISRGLVTVHENVKKRAVIQIVDDVVKLRDPAAAFTDQATTTAISEKYLDPVQFEFHKQEDYSELYKSWQSSKLKAGQMNNYNSPQDLADFMVERYLTKIKVANERLFWLGKASVQEATMTSYTGLIPKLITGASSDVSGYKLTSTAYAFSAITAATGVMTVSSTAAFRDGDVVTITALSTGTTTETTTDIFGNATSGSVLGQSYIVTVGSATTLVLKRNLNKQQTTRGTATFATNNTGGGTIQYINVSNVATVLASVYAQLDYAAFDDPNFNLMIPLHVAKAYQTKQGELATNQLGALALPKTMKYNDMNLQVMTFFPGNTIIGAAQKNLHLGTDLLSDKNMLKVVYTGDTTADEYVRMRAGMSSDGNYVNGGEISLWYPSA